MGDGGGTFTGRQEDLHAGTPWPDTTPLLSLTHCHQADSISPSTGTCKRQDGNTSPAPPVSLLRWDTASFQSLLTTSNGHV